MKAKPFYKNNKHNNNMDSKEKENINEEELKAQAVPEENGEEATEKEEVTLTEEEKLAQELEKAHAEIEDQKDKYLRLSAEFDNYRKRWKKQKKPHRVMWTARWKATALRMTAQPSTTSRHGSICVSTAITRMNGRTQR